MANVTKVLQELETAWKDTDVVEAGVFTPPSDGNYSGKLLSGSVEMSQNGRIQIVWVLKITEGSQEGKVIRKFDGIDNEISIGYAKGMLKLVGIDIPKKAADLPKALKNFFLAHEEGMNVEFTVKTKDGFTNIYVNSADKEETKQSDTKETKKKSKKLSYTDLEDMDKSELIDLISEQKLDIDDAEKIKETKLRRLIAEELDIDVE